MKNYKIIKVKMDLNDLQKGNYKSLEDVMNDMSKQGWEVVCTSPETHLMSSVSIIVTFSKNID